VSSIKTKYQLQLVCMWRIV